MSKDLSPEYFNNLWLTNKPEWEAGEVSAAQMKDGATIPVDFCVSTVARLQEQPGAPIERIDDLVRRLLAIASDQFFYPPESRHITLLGCTQRAPTSEAFAEGRIDAIREACISIVAKSSPVKIHLRGVGVLGNQIFIQVIAATDGWKKLRKRLAEAMLEIGEDPITYADMAPIHLNIARITNNDRSAITTLFAEIQRLHLQELGDMHISIVELLLTDFVLAPANVSVLGRIPLGSK